MQLLRLFQIKTHLELAMQELAEAERELLAASSAAEYAQAIVAYNEKRILRLRSITQGEQGRTQLKNI